MISPEVQAAARKAQSRNDRYVTLCHTSNAIALRQSTLKILSFLSCGGRLCFPPVCGSSNH